MHEYKLCVYIIYIYTEGSCNYQLVGDNIDIRVNPRHMTVHHKSADHHWFQTYAVKHRITKGENMRRSSIFVTVYVYIYYIYM